MNRREFIKQTAQAAAASALIGGGVLLLGSRGIGKQNISKVYSPKNYRVKLPPDRPIIAAAKGNDWRKATAAAIAALGGIETFITKGDYVCLKPNIGWDRTPEQGADTNPDVVAEITRLCFAAGAAKVVVVDIPCNSADRTFNRSGIKAAAESEGAQVLMESESLLETVDFGSNRLGRWKVLKPILECDKLINIPIFKHHSLPGMTGAMKNWFGALSGPRNRLHQGIDQNLAELCGLFQPTLTIGDATRVLQRNGPTGGRLEDVIVYNTITASVDQVATDAYATRFLSKEIDAFPFIGVAAEKGLGISRPPKDKIAEIEV